MRKEATSMVSSTGQVIGPVFQHMSNFVKEGILGVAESAHLDQEVVRIHSSQKSACSGESTHTNVKMMIEDREKFKQIQRALRMKGCLTHIAIMHVLPDVIESVNLCNVKPCSINNHKEQHSASLIKINRLKKHQQRKQEPKDEKHMPHNKHRKVIIKPEKNGTFTWVKQTDDSLKLNPIWRRSDRCLQRRSFNARSG